MMSMLGTQRSVRGRLAELSLVGLLIAVMVLAVACGSPKPASSPTSTSAATSTQPAGVTPPDTPVGIQARWLVEATAHLPISDADARAHFDATFLAQISPAVLNQALAGTTKVTVVSIETDQPSALVMIVSTGGKQDRKSVV